MEYKSGQIIKTEAYTLAGMPIMYHFGLIFVDNNQVYVLHNDRDNGTIQEKFDDFIYNEGRSRTIDNIQSSKLEELSNEELLSRFDQCSGKFDWMNYNCEHFIDCMSRDKQKSEQLVIYALIGIALFLILK